MAMAVGEVQKPDDRGSRSGQLIAYSAALVVVVR
jgi:hypothetical protein